MVAANHAFAIPKDSVVWIARFAGTDGIIEMDSKCFYRSVVV